jgi:hypothetical protein
MFSRWTSMLIPTLRVDGVQRNQMIMYVLEVAPGSYSRSWNAQSNGNPNSKYYWFRSWLKPKAIEVQYIETAYQKADMLTKSLPTESFEWNRKLTCGWYPQVRRENHGIRLLSPFSLSSFPRNVLSLLTTLSLSSHFILTFLYTFLTKVNQVNLVLDNDV